jgi:hypothetical protein
MKKIFTLFAAILVTCSITKSQTTLEDFSFQVYYQTTSEDPLVFDSLCTRVCKVEIPDSTNLARIYVNVGTAENTADVINNVFEFDEEEGLPAGLTYRREGNIVYLGLLQTTQADTYYYKLWLEDLSGTLTEEKKWN